MDSITARERSADLERWKQLGRQIRVDSIRATTAAGSGHPTSSMSAADLMAVLLSEYFTYDFEYPKNPNNDHFVLSKGHASPLLYAMFKAAGAISDKELLTLRKLGSKLEGHPTPVLPWVDVATGSLGQGLPIAVGIAIAGKYLDKLPYRIWTLLGDGECAEGAVWEAFKHAAYYKLDNLTAIIDANRLGQSDPTMDQWNTSAYAGPARAFGWHTIEIDGHDYDAIDHAFREALSVHNKPTVIVARTEKGSGVSFLSNEEGWHGKALNHEQEAEALDELGGESSIVIRVARPPETELARKPASEAIKLPAYEVGKSVATRRAFGDTLKAIGAAHSEVVALDGDVKNSTYSEDFKKAYPDRFFEMFIAEQQMVAAAVGLAVRGYKPFASTFAAFLSRASDFVRMASISRANIKLMGSHAGVSIGQDGPSQMGLEDIAAFRSTWGSTVLYPSDATQTASLMEQMVGREGIVYIRTTRENTPVLYKSSEKFPIGGSKVVRRSAHDRAVVVAAGITLHEALKAYDRLQIEQTHIRVIDCYSIKPIDGETLRTAVSECEGQLIVVEDHHPEGGLGEAVLEALTSDGEHPAVLKGPLRFTHLAVRNMPGSATPEEQLRAARIDAAAIIESVKALVRQPVTN